MSKNTDPSTFRLSVKDIAHRPAPGMAVPASFAFSPDDRFLAYLYSPDHTLERRLYVLNMKSGVETEILPSLVSSYGETTESLADELRKQRQRQMETGIYSYQWGGDGDHILICVGSDVFVVRGLGESFVTLSRTPAVQVTDPQFSSDGSRIGYVHNREVWMSMVDGNSSMQLTFGADKLGTYRGRAEYIAQEEMGRRTGFWWSPTGEHIAFTEIDERHIPVYRIVHQGKGLVGDGAQEDHRYPFAGKKNANFRLGVVSIAGDDPVWMNTSEWEYLARIAWVADGTLVAQMQNREQTKLVLARFDIATGKREDVLIEESDTWINLTDCFFPLAGGGFMWCSERTGFRHLYHYDRCGNFLNTITQGTWQVDEVHGVDENRGRVYFTGTLDDPRERHLYTVNISGGQITKLTCEPGLHNVVLDHGCQYFVDVQHSIEDQPSVSIRKLENGVAERCLFKANDCRVGNLRLKPPELISIENRNGTLLHGAIYWPSSGVSAMPFPTVISVYGGPGAQMVTNSWVLTASMRAQYLSSLGFLVFVLDNRGSGRRGMDFEAVLKGSLGRVEVDDQVDGVRWLIDQGFSDPSRIGVYGWSYGGFMALRCLSLEPDIFRVAVSGAPVVEWDGYDTHYTERYLGMPESNVAGYINSGVLAHIDGIQGKLLLVHGLLDENVHFRHSARLINALVSSGKEYDLLLFPDERHMPRKETDREYMEKRIGQFFESNLLY